MRWNGASGPPGRRPSPAAAEPWLADYRARGIEAISTGAIVIRKRSGENWARFEELALATRGDAGPHLERLFAAQDLLRGLRDERELLTVALALAPDTLLVERRLRRRRARAGEGHGRAGDPLARSRSRRRSARCSPPSTGAGRSPTLVEAAGRRRARLAGSAVGRVHSGAARARRPRPARRRRALKLVEWTLTCTPPSGRLDGLATRRGYPWRTTRRPNEERQTDERDEMDDLDVTQQQAEDIKGGRRAIKHKDL